MPDDLDEKSKDKAIEKAKTKESTSGWASFFKTAKAVLAAPIVMADILLNGSDPKKAEVKTPEQTMPSYTVTAEGLNFRKSAGAGNDKMNPLKKGDIVTATGQTQDTWMEVKTKDGKTGWITSKPQFTKKN
jgi:uncharacterized protein YgiM (DUF1202 family)